MTSMVLLRVVLVTVVLGACGRPDRAGAVEVTGAVVGEAPVGADAAVYFDVIADAGDTIVAVVSQDAAAVTLHELRPLDGGGIMVPSESITVGPGTTRLEPMGSHVMLTGLRRDLRPGGTIELTVEFARHDPVVARVEVVPLYELAELVGGAG